MNEAEQKKWTHILRQEKYDICRIVDEINFGTSSHATLYCSETCCISIYKKHEDLYQGEPFYMDTGIYTTVKPYWDDDEIKKQLMKLRKAKEIMLAIIDTKAFEDHHTEQKI